VCQLLDFSASESFIIIIIIIAIEFSLGGISSYTGTDKTNKNKRAISLKFYFRCCPLYVFTPVV
jgi:hypothetical protein